MRSKKKGSSVCGLHPYPYVRGCKRALVGPSFTQGPKGWWGSSGSQGLKTSERGRNIQTEEEKQRWAEMGCVAGRQTAEELKKKNREKSTSFGGGCDTLIQKSKQQNEEAEGSRADEGLEASEKVSWLPQEKAPEQKCSSSLFHICTNTFSKRRKGEEDGKG